MDASSRMKRSLAAAWMSELEERQTGIRRTGGGAGGVAWGGVRSCVAFLGGGKSGTPEAAMN